MKIPFRVGGRSHSLRGSSDLPNSFLSGKGNRSFFRAARRHLVVWAPRPQSRWALLQVGSSTQAVGTPSPASGERLGGLGLPRPAALSRHGYPNSHPHPIRPSRVFPLLLANLHNHSLPVFPRNQISVLVFSSQRPIMLLTLSHTLTTQFALRLLRHGKHAQTERKDTLFNRESEGPGAEVQTRQSRAPPSRPYQNTKRLLYCRVSSPTVRICP